MKKIALIFCALVIHTSAVFAQWTTDSIIHPADSIHQVYRLRTIEMYEHVDLTQVPSGILYDRGFPFVTFEPFKGIITDSSETTIMTFGLAYAALSSMSVSIINALPPPDAYRSIMDTIRPDSDVIPIAGLNQLYHKMDSNSIPNANSK